MYGRIHEELLILYFWKREGRSPERYERKESTVPSVFYDLCGGYTDIPRDLRVIYEQKLVKMAFHQELVGKILSSSYVTCRNLLLNTRNNSGDSPSLGTRSPTVWNGSKRSGNFSRVANSGLARMSVASPSQIGRMSLGDSYVTRHGRKSVTSHSWNWSRVATFAESHRRDIRASRVTREWLVSDLGSTCELWPITWLRHPAVYNLIEAVLGKLSVITSRSGVVHKSIMAYHDGRALVGGATARVSCR